MRTLSSESTGAFSRPVRWMSTLCVLAAVLMLAACGGGTPMPTVAASESVESSYHLGPGDRVQIDVFGDESLSGERRVDSDGQLTMPLIGRVEAVDLTAEALQQRIQTRLQEYMREPRVNVEILSYRPVYVVGEVRQPGSYDYVDGMTVINAVAVAGGFTYRARQDQFVIERKESGQRVAGSPTTPLLPGDVVTVKERYF